MHDYKDNFSNAIEFAVKKTKLAWWKLIFLGVMGCIYVGIAYIAFIAIIAGTQDKDVFVDGWKENLLNNNIAPNVDIKGWPLVVAGAIFPVGLLLIIFLGGSLFTSDNLTSIAILTQKVKVSPVVVKWGLTLLGNLIGAFMIAGIARGANIFDDKQLFVLQQIITKKVYLEWW
ncbi:MAG: formate/nitrite transporter family protein, partial [Metamycoplasmataceae bacterium]